MPKGIKVDEIEVGTGPIAGRGNIVIVGVEMFLNRGEAVWGDPHYEIDLGRRDVIAGLRYGIEGMREGGRRKFRVSPHLGYGDQSVPGVPPNAVLVFSVTLHKVLPGWHVGEETRHDTDGVRAVLEAAFPTTAEANLVDCLRTLDEIVISFVAVLESHIIGHVVFTRVELSTDPTLRAYGLGPLGVGPEHQRKGVGSALVKAGLDWLREAEAEAVVVLGHPTYYPRFGFVPSSRYGITCEYDVPEDIFMLLELVPGALTGRTGVITYHKAFRGV